MYEESYINDLLIRAKGTVMKDRICKKACGNCGNDLVKPYAYCHFCGYRVIESKEVFDE